MLPACTTLDQQGATDMAEEVLKVTRHPNYAVLTLNRPEKRNALNQPLIDALDQALRKFENDREIRALLLARRGRELLRGNRSEGSGRDQRRSQSDLARIRLRPAGAFSGADHRGCAGRRARGRTRAGAALRPSNRVGEREARHDARTRRPDGAVRFHAQADRGLRIGQHRLDSLHRRPARRRARPSHEYRSRRRRPTRSSARRRLRWPRR